MKKKRCLIFGAALPVYIPEINEKERKDLFIIAADGGYGSLKKAGIKPDMIVGDFDSYNGDLPDDVKIIRHPVEKDETDTMLAVMLGEEQKCDTFELYGCLGGERFDHGIAALQVMTYIAKKGNNVKAFLKNSSGTVSEVTAISDGAEVTFPSLCEGVFSVLCADGACEGVSVCNAKYTLENAVLSPDNPLGVSNSFIKGKSACVSVKKGTLWIFK